MTPTSQRGVPATGCHVQYMNWGERAGGLQSLLGHRSGGGDQLHCASLACSWVLFLPLFVIFLFIITVISLLFYFSY